MKSKKKQEKDFFRIILKSNDQKLLDATVSNVLKIIGPNCSVVALPTKRTLITVLKSTFKYKDARDQFESRLHCRTIKVYSIPGDGVGLLRNFQLPAGVDIQIRTR